MPLDLSKLSPAPWLRVPYGGNWVDRDECLAVGHPLTESGICDASHSWQQIFLGSGAQRTDIEFVVLARAAFDVLLKRRVWRVIMMHQQDQWGVQTGDGHYYSRSWADPFTALVEADKLYEEDRKLREANKDLPREKVECTEATTSPPLK
jgi:hypothetical protein